MQAAVAIWNPLWPVWGVILAPAPTMILLRSDAQVGQPMVARRFPRPTVTNRGGLLLTENLQDPVEIAWEMIVQSFTLHISLHEVIWGCVRYRKASRLRPWCEAASSSSRHHGGGGRGRGEERWLITRRILALPCWYPLEVIQRVHGLTYMSNFLS